MKSNEKKILWIGAGLMALGGLGLLLGRKKGNPRWDNDWQLTEYEREKRRKERLEWVKDKLESRKACLDKHLKKINEKLKTGSHPAPENV